MAVGEHVMASFVLIHGSWHTGNHWAPVIRDLESKGHRAAAPTVLGHGHGIEKRVNHAEQVADLVQQIVRQDLRDFVLVGHSYGGTVIARLAEEIPDRIRRLVFWNAFVPAPGHCLNDEVPPHYRSLFDGLASASPDRSVMLPYPIWREAFINDADEALAKSSYETLSPEPYQPFVDKLDLSRFYETKIPKSYLNCTEDNALPQGAEWGWHPRMSQRLGLYRLVQMPGSHEVIFSNPVGLAGKLVEAGRD
jgi:pimeloyl-ACP methyl ester carboxylesterase